jgi:hypothetical protein
MSLSFPSPLSSVDGVLRTEGILLHPPSPPPQTPQGLALGPPARPRAAQEGLAALRGEKDAKPAREW